MQSNDHLHERIARATNRLAQLQAQELVAAQRKAMRERDVARQTKARRRKRVAELVFATDSQSLEDGEIVAALLHYRSERADPEFRDQAKALGERHLSSMAAGSTQQPH